MKWNVTVTARLNNEAGREIESVMNRPAELPTDRQVKP